MANSMIAPEFLRLAADYGVNVQGVVQAQWQPVYDKQVYAAAGQSSLTFFQSPIGQGGRTIEDTNMRAAGVFPAPQQFLATQVHVQFVPGAAPIDATGAYLKDAWTVYNSGALEFNVGSVTMVTDSPVGKFPPSHLLEVGAASATTGASGINYAENKGMIYEITPANIPWAQNFDVTIKWRTPLALPSAVAGKMVVTLGGFLYRLAQ